MPIHPSTRRDFLLACAATLTAPALLKASQLTQANDQAQALLAQMTLDEKIGQMTQPDKLFINSPDDVGAYSLGSVLSGGDSDPKTGNDLISWTDMYDEYQSRAITSRLRIPLLYGVDSVHGHNNVIGATVFPHNIGLGCTRNPELVEKYGRVTSEEVRATGINWGFSPCVTVPQDIRWGRTYEGFSQDPEIVKVLGEAMVRGLQRDSLSDPLAVAACAKHFIADGGTTYGSARTGNDQGDSRIDEETLRRIHLPGYITAIKAGVATIMPSYSSWNGVHCSGSKKLLTDLLKTELGFQGFLISDYAALNELPGSYKEQIQTSINAGMDMVMVPDKWMEFIHTLRQLVVEGGVSQTRIDDAVLRILRVKVAMGLTPNGANPLANRALHRNFGSPEHRAVARECVRQSLVLLKNEGGILPLSKSASHIHIAGETADNMGNQCGGWTIRWQGQSGENEIGTTILEAMRAAAPNVKFTNSHDGSGGQDAAIGVAVIGENPYAEMMGDRADLRISSESLGVVARMKAAGMKVVVVLVSGRPLLIEDLHPYADAIIAAWLPGTEGDGVADVLFGSHNPTGKLSFSWPKATSTTFNVGESGYQTLHPVGFGLSY